MLDPECDSRRHRQYWQQLKTERQGGEIVGEMNRMQRRAGCHWAPERGPRAVLAGAFSFVEQMPTSCGLGPMATYSQNLPEE